jgi:hypothetical protein
MKAIVCDMCGERSRPDSDEFNTKKLVIPVRDRPHLIMHINLQFRFKDTGGFASSRIIDCCDNCVVRMISAHLQIGEFAPEISLSK